MKKTRRILVAGVGNILKSDDGLGYSIIEQLRKHKLPDNVETLHLETLGLSILHYLEGYDKVIFIDAIKKGGAPGSIYLYKPQGRGTLDKPKDAQIPFMSMHEVDLEKVIALGKNLDELPSEILIIGCEPEDVDTIKIGLTDKVQAAIPKILELLLEELSY